MFSSARPHRSFAHGFGLVESMLALVVFSVAIGAIIKVWVDDHQIQQVQRQAEVLQTARLATQRVISFYRNTLAASSSPSISSAIDGTVLATSIAPSSAGAVNQWRFTRAQLVDLKVLEADFPTTGVYGSLGQAQLQINLSANTTGQTVTGTVCYDQPLTKDGQVDLQSLGALVGQVSRNVSVVASGANGSSYQSGVFLASYPGAGATLKGSVSGVTAPNPVTGTPAGTVCALVGDWGGLENTGRTAYTTVKLNDACAEPNGLAWVNPNNASTQPHVLAWCNGTNWKLFQGGTKGGACTEGRMAIDQDVASTTYLQPLMCGAALSYVAGRMVPYHEDYTCTAAREGFLTIGKTDQKFYVCKAAAWTSQLGSSGEYAMMAAVENTACSRGDRSSLAVTATSPYKLLACINNNWWKIGGDY